MKAVHVLLALLTSFTVSSAVVADEKERPLAPTTVQPGGDTGLTGDGPVKAIHLNSGTGAVAVVAGTGRLARTAATLAGADEVHVSGASEVVDGEAISFSFAVTAGDADLAPFTLDVEYSAGLNVGIDAQGWDCTLDAPGHASCEWVTTLLAGEATGTATFSAFAQPPYGGAAECDPGRSPCAFLRATLPAIATGVWTTAMVVDDNHPPVAADDMAAVPLPAAPVTIEVLDNDTEPDGGPLTLSVAVPPTQGTVTVDPATQGFLYTPDPRFSGSDTFRYQVTDPAGASAAALVTVHQLLGSVAFQSPVVDVGNLEPGHVAFRLNYLQNTTGIDLLGTVAVEPVDAGEFPALLAGTGYDPAQAVSDVGVFSGSGGGVRFDAAVTVGSFGVPTRLNPPVGRVWLARVKLTVSPVTTPSIVFEPSYVVVARSAHASEVPVHVVDDVVSTPADTPLLIHPLDDDDSAAGEPLSVTGLAIAEPFYFDSPFMEGTAEFADGTAGGVPFLGILYTPPAGFTGTTQLYYAASETPNGIINGRYDYAKVTVVVGAVGNQAPLAHSQAPSFRHDTSRHFALSALATGAEGDPLTLQIVTPPAHGTATVLATGDVQYEPAPHFAGSDFSEFRVAPLRSSAGESPELAQVDGADISRAAFDEACGRLRIASEALREAVDSQLVERAAVAADIVVDDELPPAERRRAQLEQLAPSYTAETFPEEAVRDYYDRHRHLFDAPERFFVEHDEQYFEVTEDDGIEHIEALRKLRAGERSEPLPYEGKARELRLVAHEPAVSVSYEEARLGIAERLATAVTEAHQADTRDRLRQEAHITYAESAQCPEPAIPERGR